MLLLIRMVMRLIGSSCRSRIPVLGESLTSYRVLLNDADIYRHLNNGRYLSVMDLGRLDLIIRMGIFWRLVRRRWYPVVGSANIRFFRSIDLFQRYEMRSRILCWDEKWFFIEQRFEREGRLMAVALIKGLFLGPQGKIDPSEVARLAGHDGPSPAIPEPVRMWAESDSAFALAQLERSST
jgi:acyl-CoA thioesterase FadM